jgi:hypothetical protein
MKEAIELRELLDCVFNAGEIDFLKIFPNSADALLKFRKCVAGILLFDRNGDDRIGSGKHGDLLDDCNGEVWSQTIPGAAGIVDQEIILTALARKSSTE